MLDKSTDSLLYLSISLFAAYFPKISNYYLTMNKQKDFAAKHFSHADLISKLILPNFKQSTNSTWYCFNRPLKRMTVGMLLAAIAFVCAALVQVQVDVSVNKINKSNDSWVHDNNKCSFPLCTNFQATLPTFPSTSQSQLKLLNMGNTPVTVQMPHNEPLELLPAQVCPHINKTLSLQVQSSVQICCMCQTLLFESIDSQYFHLLICFVGQW